MTQSEYGLRPDTQIVEHAFSRFSGSLKIDWHICSPLIDSAAVTPKHWQNWLHLLEEKLPHYDGILVLHGTDTLAYTANFLALTLHTQNKPIILTGAQKPFHHPQSDALNNIQTAIKALQNSDINEVLLAFNGQLFPAIGSSKCSTENDNAFHNTHFGTWPTQNRIQALSRSRHFCPESNIATLFFTPNTHLPSLCSSLNNPDIQAAILMTFGHGNPPSNPELIHTLQKVSQEKLLLNISQVPQGCATSLYEQNHALSQAGVINAGKCTIETASVLLMIALSNHWSRQDLINELNRLRLLSWKISFFAPVRPILI